MTKELTEMNLNCTEIDYDGKEIGLVTKEINSVDVAATKEIVEMNLCCMEINCNCKVME